MPNFAYLATDLYCPYCKGLVIDWVAFQWGYSPGYDVYPEWEYHLDDPIQWRRCSDGRVLPWTLFREGKYPHEVNLGDPRYMDVIIQAQRTFWWHEPSERPTCPACQSPLEGAAVQIRGGHIKRAWIYLPGELAHDTDYWIGPNDELVAMPEWRDHPLNVVLDC